MCHKKPYGSRNDAARALLTLWQKGRPEKAIHWCESCDSYHLTSKARPGEWLKIGKVKRFG